MTLSQEKHRDLIKEIFQHRWYEPILRILNDGEARYREIRAGLITRYPGSPGDGYISRELAGLSRAGLVHKRETGPNRYLYSLTDDGLWAIGVFDAAYRAPMGNATAVATEQDDLLG
ncbi:winged helix-turn-helix transcriptional regulator [Actinoplanes sp. L3-i22]|uniref:winged helix-turn-helix transcriptional regulator n=1 Tax=Actinoplanes sp. L3-i22 TaxID=2836373 RepID=UPI001C7544CE|nr:winged helix-turn-helix transcriptional regulator [Actinoplanes sp. L3-i22]BCY13437.1 hypothetical protein L3i22_085250 [Actinoplanes sp. L3-i22]